MYKIKTDQFEGPLSVLLQLIEKNKLNITDFSLAEVAGDYLNYIKNKSESGEKLRNLSEFLWIASRLTLLKSKALLPEIDLNSEEEDDLEELKSRLQEYRRFKEISKKIEKNLESGKFLLTREKDDDLADFNQRNIENKKECKIIDKEELLRLYQNLRSELFELNKQIEEEERGSVEFLSVSDKVAEIEQILEKKVRMAFFKMVSNRNNKEEVVVSFLSVLQLLKQKNIILKQDELFGELLIEKRC
ncbi:MAG: segregation/condensation protein A [Candidatus Moraniibacteriota bacterium]